MSELELFKMMADVLYLALDDLEDWHSESLSFTAYDGSIEYLTCPGCVTCIETIPQVKEAIERLINKVGDDELLAEI